MFNQIKEVPNKYDDQSLQKNVTTSVYSSCEKLFQNVASLSVHTTCMAPLAYPSIRPMLKAFH